MNYLTERCTISPNFIGDAHGNPTSRDLEVEEVFMNYVHKLERFGYIYKPNFIPHSDGDAESGMCAPDEDGTYDCSISALKDLLDNTGLEPEDVKVEVIKKDENGKEYYERIEDVSSYVYDAVNADYNEVFNEFTSYDWSLIQRALREVRNNPGFDKDDCDTLAEVMEKLI